MREDFDYFKSYFAELSHLSGSQVIEKKISIIKRNLLILRILGIIGSILVVVAVFISSNSAAFTEFFVEAILPYFWRTGLIIICFVVAIYPLQVRRRRELQGEMVSYFSSLETAKEASIELEAQRLLESEAEAQKGEDDWLVNRVRPKPQPYGVSDQGAEHLVSEWLQYLGFEDAQVTQYSGDGGIDVETIEHVVQVKNYRDKAVSVTEVRELFGVAASERKRAVLFTSSSCTSQAIEFADKNGIALIKFDSRQASLVELNDEGSDFLVNGEYEDE